MEAKAAAKERFDEAREQLIGLSHRIHAHPELGFEEEKSSTWLCEALDAAGFTVEKGICDLPTAFRARARLRPSPHRHLRGVRLPPRHRPRLRPQHHRRLSDRRGPRRRQARRRGGPHHQRHRHARRRSRQRQRQNPHARARRLRRHPRRHDGPPRALRHGQGEDHRRVDV